MNTHQFWYFTKKNRKKYQLPIEYWSPEKKFKMFKLSL